ncbi:MAG TPA: DNA polymerase Y family protein [Burkholderiales bacterium]
MLWLCANLPNLAIEIGSRGAPANEPLAIAEGEGREQRIVAANEYARHAGVCAGAPIGEAYALIHNLRVRPRCPSAEREALAQLAAWSGQYTSFVSLAPPDALLLEVEGSRNLFGSYDRLVASLRRGLKDLGYGACIAVAPTPLGATWLARGKREVCVTDHAALFSALAKLPLTCLDLDADGESLLRALGLTALIDCLRLPRDGIARRVGPHILELLDRAFGRKPDPRSAFVPPEHFRARLALPAPVATRDALLFPLHRLLLELAGFLLARGSGAAELVITLRAGRGAPSLRVSLPLVTPSRDAQHLTDLVRERLERMTLKAPVEEVLLQVEALPPLAPQPADFFAGARPPDALRAQLVERLQARLGRDAVRGIATHADHRPERGWRYVEAGAAGEAVANRRRPMWLLPEPMALEIREGAPYRDGALALETGQERIESGWWDGADIGRDYFIARDAHGRRLWIFREMAAPRRWFLHGVFG